MISFVIPTLNEETALEKLLRNLSAYSGSKEIIVSDGKSQDKTGEIARRFTDKVLVYDGETRQTIAMGRNAGGQIAVGDYVVFLDADVTVKNPDEFFARALKYFSDDAKLVAITGRLRVLPENETWADRLNFEFINCIHRVANNVLRIGMATGEFQMIKRVVYDRLGGFTDSIVVGEDQEFFRRLSRNGRTRYCHDLVVYHTGRRPHKLGWPRLWFEWLFHGVFNNIFKKSLSKEWKVIR